ncbi:MAG: ParB N-terminal domain-containing protein [Bradyrhizobium sp.]|nr:ParB N-terminal domain-containing protein [Bradyrhizobium sp.]
MTELEPLHLLTFDIAPRCAAVHGEQGDLAWIPLRYLYIDPAYQRAILKTGKANVRRMIEDFSWERFGACVVSRRGKNRYAIIDGQHRATAALNRGDIDAVPCLIVKGDRAAEARAFNAINGNVTRVLALQSFRAAVAGGDPAAVSIVDACVEAGVTIAPYQKPDLAAGETTAIGAMRQCMRGRGRETLVTALIVLRAADPQGSLPAIAVKGLCEIAAKHPEWNADAAKIGELLGRGGTLAQLTLKAIARAHQRGGAHWKNFADIAEMQIAAGQRSLEAPLSRLMAGR